MRICEVVSFGSSWLARMRALTAFCMIVVQDKTPPDEFRRGFSWLERTNAERCVYVQNVDTSQRDRSKEDTILVVCAPLCWLAFSWLLAYCCSCSAGRVTPPTVQCCKHCPIVILSGLFCPRVVGPRFSYEYCRRYPSLIPSGQFFPQTVVVGAIGKGLRTRCRGFPVV